MADKNTKFSKEEIENVKEFSKAFRNVNDEVNSLFEGLNSISDEIKGQVQGYQLANKAVNNLTGVFGKLKDIQENIKNANSEDLKSLKEKALTERKNLVESQRLLQIKATTVGLSIKEVATLANVNGILEEQEGIYQDIENTLSQIVKNEQTLHVK
jgi:chromosome segregation ATPase